MRKRRLTFENSLMTSVILAGMAPLLTLILVFWLNEHKFALSALVILTLFANLLYFAWGGETKGEKSDQYHGKSSRIDTNQ